jgi:YhcH/YjgK/YiaL family protein
MILDAIEHAFLYNSIHPSLPTFFSALQEYTPTNFPSLTRYLDGNNAFLIFKQYETKSIEDAKLEAHNEYWDIMYMVEGEETVYVKPRKNLAHITTEYTVENEALLAELDPDCTAVHLSAGQFLILFPEDAHCPEREYKGKKNVKKIVGKLRKFS